MSLTRGLSCAYLIWALSLFSRWGQPKISSSIRFFVIYKLMCSPQELVKRARSAKADVDLKEKSFAEAMSQKHHSDVVTEMTDSSASLLYRSMKSLSDSFLLCCIARSTSSNLGFSLDAVKHAENGLVNCPQEKIEAWGRSPNH